MQQSSKGNSAGDVTESPSAFSVCSKDGKIKRPNSGKRDSGYHTDNSPAAHGNQLMFNFDDIPPRSDEHPFHASFESSGVFDLEEQLSGDTSDQEVEMVLSNPNSPGLVPPIPVSSRPSAPLPRESEMQLDLIHGIDSGDHLSISSPSQNRVVSFQRNRSRRHGCYFRPIVNRSVGTQTPTPTCQIVHDVIDRFHPYGHIRDSLTRNRHNSAGEQNPSTSSPLPDIIPTSRDRSVSLPDVPSLRQQQEQAVGRELRRISDEFHYAFTTPPRRASVLGGAQSFPGSVRFNMGNLWDTLRNLISSPVTIRHDNADDDGDDEDDVFPAKC